MTISQLQLTCTQHFCTLTVAKNGLQNHQKSQNCVKTKFDKALYGYRKAPKLWAQHVVTLVESLKYHPFLTDANCFRNDELDINIFTHADDGLLVGLASYMLRFFELVSNQVVMRIVGRLARLDDQTFFLGRVIVRTARGYWVEANSKYIRDVIGVLGLEDLRLVSTPSVDRTPTTESLVELENDKRTKHVQRAGNNTKDLVSH